MPNKMELLSISDLVELTEAKKSVLLKELNAIDGPLDPLFATYHVGTVYRNLVDLFEIDMVILNKLKEKE